MFCVWTLEAGGETVNSYTVPDVFRCISTWDDYVIAGGQSGSIHVWSTTLAKPVYMTTSGSGTLKKIHMQPFYIPQYCTYIGILYLYWDTIPILGYCTYIGILYLYWDTIPILGYCTYISSHIKIVNIQYDASFF